MLISANQFFVVFFFYSLHRETNRANREATIPSEKDLLVLSLPVLILVLIRKNISSGVDDQLPTEYRVSFCPEHLTFYVLGQKKSRIRDYRWETVLPSSLFSMSKQF